MIRAAAVVLALILTCCVVHADDFEPVREIEVDGMRVLIDNTNTRLKLTVDTETGPSREGDISRSLFPSYTAAAEAVDEVDGDVLPSVNLLYAKGKTIDDGAYAAVEVAAETDFGELALGKPALIRGVLDAVLRMSPRSAARDHVVAYLASALATADQLDRDPSDLGISLNSNVGRKPIGFYTWSPQLEAIYRRDTALQERFDQEQFAAETAILAMAVSSDPLLHGEYMRINALYSAPTNPIRGLTVDDVMVVLPDAGPVTLGDPGVLPAVRKLKGPGLALLQPSRSKEMFLLWEAAASGSSSIEELIGAIRHGRIDLTPNEQSGWYEYQQHALEPLLLPDDTPEARKLNLTSRYRSLLEQEFKAIIGGARETHVKQLELIEGVSIPMVAIEPQLACEPIATSYLRFGTAYGFLRDDVLSEHLGTEALTELHAIGPGAEPREKPLGAEITGMQRLMQGAYLLTCRDIGLQPAVSGDVRGTMEDAEAWLGDWRSDPDMQRDVRFMIPVARDPDVFWCTLGVRLAKVTVSFETPPKVTSAETGQQIEPRLQSATCWVPFEETLEVIGNGTELSREQFRALCDQYGTREEIAAALTDRLGDRSQEQGGWRSNVAEEAGSPLRQGLSEWLLRAAIVVALALIPVAWLSLKSYQRDGWIGLLPLAGVMIVLVTIAVTLLRM